MITGGDDWDGIKFERRRLINGIYLASPEDVILNKLRWRERNLSEKQWRDVLGVLKIQGSRLNFDYLNEWATKLGLIEDLKRAIGEAGLT
ncbi:MAG: hypothetical protein F6K19_39915 [Cyanothece sp. SIO1E1]|nr:hypothetical protein [Cyanothece sp. SIO1E1]